MSKRSKARKKITRRLGCDLWQEPNCPYTKRPYKPGETGQKKRFSKMSDYGQHLLEKQKFREYYCNVSETQLRNAFKQAVRRGGNVIDNLVALHELRLDIVVYRLNWAPTMRCARQLVSHCFFRVNGKKVNVASMVLNVGDEISVRPSSMDCQTILESIVSGQRETPSYLEVNQKELTGKILRKPSLSEVPYPVSMDMQSIVEFYSR